MANSFTAAGGMCVGSFDTNGSSDSITVTGAKNVDIAIDFGGTFDGNIDLEGEYRTGAANAMQWQVIENYTGDTAKVVQVATARRLRLTAKSITTGEALFELAAGNRTG